VEVEILDRALECQPKLGFAFEQRIKASTVRSEERAVHVPEDDFRVAHVKNAAHAKKLFASRRHLAGNLHPGKASAKHFVRPT
jgi:hypothetical protein